MRSEECWGSVASNHYKSFANHYFSLITNSLHKIKNQSDRVVISFL